MEVGNRHGSEAGLKLLFPNIKPTECPFAKCMPMGLPGRRPDRTVRMTGFLLGVALPAGTPLRAGAAAGPAGIAALLFAGVVGGPGRQRVEIRSGRALPVDAGLRGTSGGAN